MIPSRPAHSRRRSANPHRVAGWVISFLLTAGVVMMVVARQRPPTVPTVAQPSGTAPATTSPEIILSEQRYRQALQELFSGWDPRKKADFSGVHQQLLEITVPARYRTLHLDLVIVFNTLKRGQESSDQASVEEGLEQLDKIFQSAPWIRQADPPVSSPK